MPSAGKRTLSGWVMVIACPSMVGMSSSLAGCYLGRRTGRRLVRVVRRDPGALEDGGDEVRLGEGADEGRLAIDHGVRNAADAELIREIGEFVRLNADRAYLWRRQRHPVGQAHGPGTVGSSRGGK